jgi:serine/threonine protein kinase
MKIGRWTLVRHLDKGGSGDVWIARDGTGAEIALKVLWRQAYANRFQDEIKLYRQLGDRSGILPLIDADFPDPAAQRAGARPWLAMAIGTPVREHLGKEASLAAVVEAVKSYAETLAALAEEGIYHRDLKPSNLYWAGGQFAIGDFGIADFPDKAGLTATGDKLGPANFLAPEMIEYSGDVPRPFQDREQESGCRRRVSAYALMCTGAYGWTCTGSRRTVLVPVATQAVIQPRGLGP